MAGHPTISSIKLPSGNIYDIKDAEAREQIQLLSASTSFVGISETAITDGSSTSSIVVGDKTVQASNGNIAIYGNKEFIFDGSTWHEFGDLTTISASTQTENVLGSGTIFTSNPSNVTFSGGSNSSVLGSNTSFALESGNVTHGTPTTSKVLGENTQFTASKPTVDFDPTTKYLSASASGGGTSFNSKDEKTVITSLSTTSDTFVKSVTAETNKKLVTTSIVPTNGTESVSKVTQSASKLVTQSIPNVTNASDVSVQYFSSLGSASTFNFAMGTGDESETLCITGANSTIPQLGDPITASRVTMGAPLTAATGATASNGTGADVVTSVNVQNVDVAKVGTALDVATGATATNGTGAAIVTGVTIGESAPAITSVDRDGTANVIGSSCTLTNAQPTITLTANTTSGTGRVTYLEGASVDVSAPTVTAGANNKVDAITEMPTSTVNTSVSASTDNLVNAITSVGTATAAAQTITVTPDTVAAVTQVTVTNAQQQQNP